MKIFLFFQPQIDLVHIMIVWSLEQTFNMFSVGQDRPMHIFQNLAWVFTMVISKGTILKKCINDTDFMICTCNTAQTSQFFQYAINYNFLESGRYFKNLEKQN